MALLRKNGCMVITTHKLNLTKKRYFGLTSCSLRSLFSESKVSNQCSKQIIAAVTKTKKKMLHQKHEYYRYKVLQKT